MPLKTMLGCCEHANEPLGLIKYGEFREYLSY
jgi:hypothetical protein